MKKILPRRMESLLAQLLAHSKIVYKDRLLTLSVFGSWASGRNTPESDVDILIVAEKLPKKRLARVEEFEKIEKSLEESAFELSLNGILPRFSPIFKTPDEVRRGSLLFLDMLYDIIILYDKDSFFRNYLKNFKERLDRLGTKRIARGEVVLGP